MRRQECEVAKATTKCEDVEGESAKNTIGKHHV